MAIAARRSSNSSLIAAPALPVQVQVPVPVPLPVEDPIMSAIVGPPVRRRRHRRRRRGQRSSSGGRDEATSYRAVWVSRDSRLMALVWGYGDSLAFLLVRNRTCYACVFSRGSHGLAATVERLS